MRNLLAVCAALVVALGIVSGTLWKELRSARQQVVDLQEQLAEARTPVVVQSIPAPVPSPPPPIEVPPPAPPVAALPPEPVPPPPPPPPPRPANVIVSLPERPLGLPTLNAPLAAGTPDEQRTEALAQSDRTATARVAAWNSALNLNLEQLQALNGITREELRRETEESLQITSNAAPMDARSAARLKVETVTRQHATLLRILEKMTPHLNPEQTTRMDTMFASWLRANMARARAEEEAVLSGQ